MLNRQERSPTLGHREELRARMHSFTSERIILYGDAHRPGSGGFCYAETLRDMGHEVFCASDDALLQHYSVFPHRLIRRVLRAPLERDRRLHAATLVALAAAKRPSIVIVLKGLYIGAPEVRALQALGAWVVNINHDDFFSQNPNNWSWTQRDAVAHYDFVFVTREVNVEEIRSINPRVELMPFAYYPRIHRPVAIPAAERDVWQSDVVFVGTWELERCRMLEHLVRHVPARYAIWGNLWGRAGAKSPLRPHIRGRGVVVDDMCKAIGGSEIALAFLRKKNRDDYTQRTFEIPACGGLLLAERTPRHQAYYQEGIEAEFFDAAAPDELVRKVRELLANSERRDSLRQRGREALQAQHHTYRDRLDRLLTVYSQSSRAVDGRQPIAVTCG